MDMQYNYSDPNPDSPTKERKAPSSPSGEEDDAQGEKLCIVCTSCAMDIDDDTYHIFILDLDGASVVDDTAALDPPLKLPTLRFGRKCLPTDALCVVDSTLYLFASAHMPPRPRGQGRRKSVYTYNFPSNISGISDKRLEKADLVRIDDMHDSKCVAVALPTPDRKKILAFSTTIRLYHPDEPDELCDFEIYDPLHKKWYRLPNMPAAWRFANFRVTTYSFVSDDTFLLRTDKIGIFTLDISSPDCPDYNQRWHRLPEPWRHRPDWADVQTTPMNFPLPGSGYLIFVEDDLFLTRRLTYDKSDAYEYPNLSSLGNSATGFYPNLSSLGHNFTGRIRSIALLTTGHDELKFCIAQSEIESKSLRPHLIVNVYKLNLTEYKKAKKKMDEQGIKLARYHYSLLPGTTTLMTFKFLLMPEVSDEYFGPLCLFPFRLLE